MSRAMRRSETVLVSAPGAALANARASALLGTAVALAIVLVYGDTARTMVGLWRSSETYSHGFVVVPIALWLIWRRRAEVAHLPVRPFWPALALVAAAGFVWLLGRLADADVVQHLALVMMIIGAVPAVLGTKVARALAFPLAFLLFAVPFGEAFVPWLIDRTADFTVAALKLTGVPVYREGNHFVIPTGQWSVVEACSGLRYLIASLMAGTLYAYLMYHSLWRRAAFIAASLLVPLVANWLRAYLIVMLGHLSGNELAVGVDHLIYGWVFFGLVIALMFWIGTLFRDDASHSPTLQRDRATAMQADAGRATTIGSALAAVAMASLWFPLAAALAPAGDRQHRAIAAIEGREGWRPVAAAGIDWQPRFVGHVASLRQAFERDGRRVVLYVAYYAGQTEGHEMVNSANVLVPPADPLWREVVGGGATLEGPGGTQEARTATISGPAGRLDVVWWYWIDGRTTTSDTVAKLLHAWSRLTRRPDDSAAVFSFTESADGSDGTVVLSRFVADMKPAIERTLADARRARRAQ